jgi:methyltransferase family protein
LAIELILPTADALRADLLSLGRTDDAISRYLSATETNHFVHPDGRREALDDIVIPPVQAALLSHLCKRCSTRLSIEIGFGMGSTACVILGTRRHVGNPFDHVVFDPHGLKGPAPGTMRGAIVESYLTLEFEGHYHRVWKPSVIGMAELVDKYGREISDFIHIDGDHHFEYVVADFLLADMLCRKGGFITFDDSLFPAVESALSYVATNRADYAMAHLPAGNLAVLQKLDEDRRPWYAFQPFEVAQRCDWTAAAPTDKPQGSG